MSFEVTIYPSFYSRQFCSTQSRKQVFFVSIQSLGLISRETWPRILRWSTSEENLLALPRLIPMPSTSKTATTIHRAMQRLARCSEESRLSSNNSPVHEEEQHRVPDWVGSQVRRATRDEAGLQVPNAG